MLEQEFLELIINENAHLLFKCCNSTVKGGNKKLQMEQRWKIINPNGEGGADLAPPHSSNTQDPHAIRTTIPGTDWLEHFVITNLKLCNVCFHTIEVFMHSLVKIYKLRILACIGPEWSKVNSY